DKKIRCRIVADDVVGSLQGIAGTVAVKGDCPQDGTAENHKESCRYALIGDVGDDNAPAIGTEFQEVVKVAADLARSQPEASDAAARNIRAAIRHEAGLDLAGHV